MSKRFGGSPVYAYSIKLRWVVGALSSVVLVLLGLLVTVLTGVKPEQEAERPSGSTAWAAQHTLVRVLSASKRIEEGTAIDSFMIQAIGVSPDSIPEGAIREEDRTLLIGKYAKQLIPTGAFLSAELVTSEMMPVLSQIPADMRAVTISLDSRSGVEWFIKAGSRVDVLLTAANQKGEKQVVPIVPFAKVFSVDGRTDPNAQAGAGAGTTKTVTLIVSELDARKIELGRNVGTLSLTLVGDTVSASLKAPKVPVGLDNLFPRATEETVAETPRNRVTFIDPQTHQRRELVLTSSGSWK